MTSDQTRFSIGWFSFAKKGKIVQAPEEMVDEEYPLLYKPFDFDEFLKFYVLEENVNDMLAMKKYCGVLPKKKKIKKGT